MSELSVVLAGAPAVGGSDTVRRIPATEADLVSLTTAAPDDTAVLALVCGAPTRRPAALARAAARGDHVVVLDEPPPVSASWLVGEALSGASAAYPGSLLVAVLPELRAHVTTRVVLGSVANLQDPAPRLVQHARSWLPGSRFTTDMRDVHSGDHPDRLVAGDSRAVVLHGGSRRSEQWAHELVDRAGLRATPVAWEGRSPWGSAHWAEASVWTRPVGEVLDEVLASVPAAACDWCGRTVVRGRPCSFCHTPVGPDLEGTT